MQGKIEGRNILAGLQADKNGGLIVSMHDSSNVTIYAHVCAHSCKSVCIDNIDYHVRMVVCLCLFA